MQFLGIHSFLGWIHKGFLPQPRLFQLISSETHIIRFLLNEVMKPYCKLVKKTHLFCFGVCQEKAAAVEGAAGLRDRAEFPGHPKESTRILLQMKIT